MAAYCPLCDVAHCSLAQLPKALIALVLDYVHAPLMISDHERAIDSMHIVVLCVSDARGRRSAFINDTAMIIDEDNYPNYARIVIMRVAVDDLRPNMTMYATVRHNGEMLQKIEASAFPWHPKLGEHLITYLSSPYITDEFLDSVLVSHPRNPEVVVAVKEARMQVTNAYMAMLYGPAHGLAVARP